MTRGARAVRLFRFAAARLKARAPNPVRPRAPEREASAERSSTALVAGAKHLHRLTTGFLPAAGRPGHPAELFQHLLHLHELLQQPIHVFDRRAAALRDALAAAPVDDVLLAPLVGRHRADDGLDAAQLLLCRLVL